MPDIYDVIIAGSGPAGSSCAYFLAKSGAKVLILEKKEHPREKFCAGGVPGAVFDILSIPCCVNSSINVEKYEFTYRGEKKHEGTVEPGLMISVRRADFDKLLLNNAISNGVLYIDNVKVTDFSEAENHIKVKTVCNREFSAKFLVAADGANSIIARKCGLIKNHLQAVCGYYEIKPDKNILDRFAGKVHLDFNFVKGGIAGIMPKCDHLWAGIYVKRKEPLAILEKKTAEYLELLGIRGEKSIFKGQLLPLYKKSYFQKDRVLLCGEAAALVNPLTGEGIKPAVDSARIASEEIIKSLETGVITNNYSSRVAEEIGKEMEIAGIFYELAYSFPRIAYEGLANNAGDALKIMNGSISYSEFLKRLKNKIYNKTKKLLTFK